VKTSVVWRLSVAVGGWGIAGKEVGEEAWCTGACERKNGEMRDGVGPRLFMAVRRRDREEKGRGVRLGVAWGQERSGEGGVGVRARRTRASRGDGTCATRGSS
jgi:hypothetical protein